VSPQWLFQQPAMSATRRLIRAARDESGAVGVEFGFVAIPFLFTMVAIFQVGYTYYQLSALDRAAHEGARALMTGIVQQNGLSASQFTQSYICPYLPAPMSCANVTVNVSVALTHAQPYPAAPPTPAVSPSTYWSTYVNAAGTGLAALSAKFCPGFAGDFIVLEVSYPVPLFSRILNPSGAGVITETSATTFVNEPFNNAQTYTGC